MTSFVTPLSDPPSRADPENFVERSDTFMSELPVFAIELNVVASEVGASNTACAAAAVSATTQAGIATTKATEAANSALDAESLTAPYLGAFATDPLTGKNSSPLADGDWYINTVSGSIRGYTVSGGWVQGLGAVAGVTSVNGNSGIVTIPLTQDFIYMSLGVI